MGALGWTALLFALLLRAQGGSGSSVHSARNFYYGVSEPVPGMPSFVAVNYVDGQCYERYDSHTRRVMPAAPWMEKVTEEDPRYWDRETDILRGWEATFRVNLATLRGRYNQSGGLHTLQVMYGCDQNEDLPSGGHYQYGYEGRDFLTFDKETPAWTATDAAALITTRRWEAEPAFAQGRKIYLEETCIEWLRKYLHYGEQTLLRKGQGSRREAFPPDPLHRIPQAESSRISFRRGTSTEGVRRPLNVRSLPASQPRGQPWQPLTKEGGGSVPPQVKVTHKDSSDGMETLHCRAHGFYPKEIDITWTKDGKVWVEDTFHGVISPNADGTYYTWHSITIVPKDRARYRCHLEHDALLEPLDLGVEESDPVWVIAVGVISAAVLLGLVVFGIIRYRLGANQGCKAPPESIQGSDSSVTGGLLQAPETRAEPPQQSHAVNIAC